MTGDDHRTPTDVLVDARQNPEVPEAVVAEFDHHRAGRMVFMPLPTDLITENWVGLTVFTGANSESEHATDSKPMPRLAVRTYCKRADRVTLKPRAETPFATDDGGRDAP